MSRAERGALALAAAMVGAVLGAGLEAGGALLLYTGAGMLGAVGFLLGLALAALGAGVWAGSPDPGAARARPVRARWIAAVVAFVAAGVYAHVWLSAPPLQQEGVARALAVLLFLAQPAYIAGSLLAGLQARSGRAGMPGAVAAAALFGAGVGAFVSGVTLIPQLDPGALFMGGAALLAVAGLVETKVTRSAQARRRTGMDGRVAIVTGVGGRGQLGYSVAEALLGAGVRVVVSGRGPEAERCAAALAAHGEVVGVAADLLRVEDAERLVEAARERFGGLDVLVNVAGGLSVIAPVAATEPEAWEREHARNATTAFLLSRAALPLLRERRGAIVNFASPAALRAPAGLAAYSAAKAAVVALTRALALEEREHGVRVNAIAPGMIDTDQNRQAVGDPQAVRWVTRAQVAAVVLFLASDAASGISGETVHVLGEGLE